MSVAVAREAALSQLEERELFWITRRRAGVAQREIAERVGVSQVTVCKFERGVFRPDDDRVEAYWAALDEAIAERGGA